MIFFCYLSTYFELLKAVSAVFWFFLGQEHLKKAKIICELNEVKTNINSHFHGKNKPVVPKFFQVTDRFNVSEYFHGPAYTRLRWKYNLFP